MASKHRRVCLQTTMVGLLCLVTAFMGWGAVEAESNSQQTVVSATTPLTISISMPVTASTTIVTPTVTHTAVITSTPVTVSYPELVAHFERTSTKVLDTAKWVVVIIGMLVGASSVLGAYSLYQGIAKLEGLNGKVTELETQTKTLMSDLEEARKGALGATARLQYFLQIRDSNPDIRLRAIGKLGASNDIAAVSMLSEVLQKDALAN